MYDGIFLFFNRNLLLNLLGKCFENRSAFGKVRDKDHRGTVQSNSKIKRCLLSPRSSQRYAGVALMIVTGHVASVNDSEWTLMHQ